MELRNRHLGGQPAPQPSSPAQHPPGGSPMGMQQHPGAAVAGGAFLHPAMMMQQGGSPAAWQQQAQQQQAQAQQQQQAMATHAQQQQQQHAHALWQQQLWRHQQQQAWQHQMMMQQQQHMQMGHMQSPGAAPGLGSPAAGMHHPMLPGDQPQPFASPGAHPASMPGFPGAFGTPQSPETPKGVPQSPAQPPALAPAPAAAPAPAPARAPAVALAPAPARAAAPAAPAGPTRFRARIPGLVRAEYARDSEVLGALEAGTIITVLETRTNEQGQQRVRFIYHNGREGWTSVVSAAGAVILEPMPEAAAPATPAAAAAAAPAAGVGLAVETAGAFPRMVAQLVDNGFLLILSCICFGDLAFEATTGASSELAGSFGAHLLTHSAVPSSVSSGHSLSNRWCVVSRGRLGAARWRRGAAGVHAGPRLRVFQLQSLRLLRAPDVAAHCVRRHAVVYLGRVYPRETATGPGGYGGGRAAAVAGVLPHASGPQGFLLVRPASMHDPC